MRRGTVEEVDQEWGSNAGRGEEEEGRGQGPPQPAPPWAGSNLIPFSPGPSPRAVPHGCSPKQPAPGGSL